MIAHVHRLGWPVRGGIDLRAAAALCLGCCLGADPAGAQIAGFVSVDSQARNRGYSVSGGDPVVAGGLSYDDPSGGYASVALTGVIAGSGPEPLSAQVNAGYAWRAGDGLSLDVGLARTDYSHYSSRQRHTHYTEAYFGIAAGAYAARLSVSPAYLRSDTPTAYIEAERTIELAQDWSLTGHVGSLAYLGARPVYARRLNYDWRIGVARRWGAVSLHAAVSGGGPGDDFYGGRTRDRTALLLGAQAAF